MLEKRYIRKDGSLVWARVRAAPLPSASGGVRSTIGIIEDITDRKQLEEQLGQAEKMEAIGRLAGGVAHDFNNLLLAIRGYAELALEDVDEDAARAKRTLGQIKDAADRAASITSQLLAFSRKQMLLPRPIDLNRLVLDVEEMLKRFVGENVELVTRLDPELGAVKLDPVQMERALVNLTINAGDAMQGEGRLTIETKRVVRTSRSHLDGIPLGPGTYSRLSVTDTGVGMDAETRERVFEPFFTTKDGGTGLGLSTVYGFVDQSNGWIGADSQVGVGTTFSLYFLESLTIADAPVEPVADGDYRGSETILLVEDDDAVRALLAEVLRGYGYRVLLARDGQESLERARGERIDVMVTDVVMPRLGGVEAASALGRSHPDTRVVYMSGHVRDLSTFEREAAGRFLQKPFPPATLARTIREVVEEE
jgi:two-component system cell cycle sensor histidine kinase/response regulator CckA